MTALLLVAVALVSAMIGSELALGSTKLQTGLNRVVVVWGLVYVAVAVYLLLNPGLSVVGVTILWGGSFLSWFGIRSHIESSILLRMLVFLRPGPLTDSVLMTKYLAVYGQSVRMEELRRGGLAADDRGRLHVTAKGRTILKVVSALR